MNIDTFKSEISKRDGLSQNNRFRVFITSPTGSADDSTSLNTLCETAILPGRSLSTNEYTNGRNFYKTPYSFINTEVTLTFHLTNDYFARNYFEAWQDSVLDPITFKAKYKSEYARSVKIEQLDAENKRVYGVELLKAFPIDITEVNLSNTEENAIGKITVTLAYDNFIKL